MAEQTVPFGPDNIPVSLKVPLELWANYDFFRDRAIDPYFQVKYKDPEDRYSGYTTETAKFIGKQMGMSPRKIEHLISSTTGGLGMDITRSGEQAIGKRSISEHPSSIPVVGRLFAYTPTPEKRKSNIEWAKKEAKAKINALKNQGKPERAREEMERWNKAHPDMLIGGRGDRPKRPKLDKREKRKRN